MSYKAKPNTSLAQKRENRRAKYDGYKGGKRKTGEKPKDFKGTLGRFFSLLAPHKGLMLLVLITGSIGAALSVTGPMLLGDIVDAIQNEIQKKLMDKDISLGEIFRILSVLLAIYGTSSVMSLIQNLSMADITRKVVRRLRERVNTKLSKMPLKYFDDNSKGDIMSRIVNDIDNISNAFQHIVTQFVSTAVMTVGVFCIMLSISPRMTLITLSVLPPGLLIVYAISRRSKRFFREQWDRTGELNGHIEEMYTGHNLVKVFGREQYAVEEFDDINDQLALVSRKAQFISGLIGPIMSFISNIGFVMICVLGGYFILRKQPGITIGVVTTFFTYSKIFMQPLVDLGHITNRLQSSLASTERVFMLLNAEEESPDDTTHTIDAPTGKVEFENVFFSYKPEKPLIENMNLTVLPGQLVAIVGHTGAGKTTLVNLLMRFYDVNAGRIAVDGVDIRQMPRENLRRIFGMVLQDTWLFEGTVKENIAYGRDGAGDSDIEAAANAARVSHFIHTLPDGYDTVLEEDGVNISQGQRQLLTIARAILSDPAILILDEATSSVDTRTEILVQQAMKTLMSGRTSFVIAHRLSTIKEADMILVMDDGRIAECGRHDELLARGGVYSTLYNSQFGL